MGAAKVERSVGRSWRIDGRREPRQRRQWTASEKAQILAESFFPGANISAVARRHGVGANVLFRWRREALDASLSAPPAFTSVITSAQEVSPCEAGATPEDEAAEDTSGARSGLIEIELAGARIRVRGAVSEAQLRAALAAVRGLA
jgi:transposase